MSVLGAGIAASAPPSSSGALLEASLTMKLALSVTRSSPCASGGTRASTLDASGWPASSTVAVSWRESIEHAATLRMVSASNERRHTEVANHDRRDRCIERIVGFLSSGAGSALLSSARLSALIAENHTP